MICNHFLEFYYPIYTSVYLNFWSSLSKIKHTKATILNKNAITNMAVYPSKGLKIYTSKMHKMPAKADADYIML